MLAEFDWASLMLREFSNDLERSETAACCQLITPPRAAYRGQLVAGLTHERVNEVGTTERSRDEGEDRAALGAADLSVAADVGEDVLVSERDEDKLAVVRVRGEVLPEALDRFSAAILQSVKGLAKKAEGLVLGGRVLGLDKVASSVDTLQQRTAHEGGGGVPVAALWLLAGRGCGKLTIRNVVLHARLGVDLELARVDRGAQAGVVLAGVLALAVALGVVNVLGREVGTETLLGDLELAGGVTVGWQVSRNRDARDASTYRGSRGP